MDQWYMQKVEIYVEQYTTEAKIRKLPEIFRESWDVLRSEALERERFSFTGDIWTLGGGSELDFRGVGCWGVEAEPQMWGCAKREVLRGFPLTSDGCAARRKPSGMLLAPPLHFTAATAIQCRWKKSQAWKIDVENIADYIAQDGETLHGDSHPFTNNLFTATHCEIPVARANKRMVKDTKAVSQIAAWGNTQYRTT